MRYIYSVLQYAGSRGSLNAGVIVGTSGLGQFRYLRMVDRPDLRVGLFGDLHSEDEMQHQFSLIRDEIARYPNNDTLFQQNMFYNANRYPLHFAPKEIYNSTRPSLDVGDGIYEMCIRTEGNRCVEFENSAAREGDNEVSSGTAGNTAADATTGSSSTGLLAGLGGLGGGGIVVAEGARTATSLLNFDTGFWGSVQADISNVQRRYLDAINQRTLAARSNLNGRN